MPLRKGNYKVLAVASLGQFLGNGLSVLVGVMLPLMEIGRRPELSAFQQGLTGCIALIGIMVGSLILGRLSDRYGYLLFYRLCPVLALAASLVAAFTVNWYAMVALLFLIGFSVGGEYSLDSAYISELMPDKWKVFMVGVAKATSALGAVLFALAGFLILRCAMDEHVWHYMFLLVSAVALIMLLSRIKAHESPQWLMAHGKIAEAQKTVREILGSDIEISVPDSKPEPEAAKPKPFSDMLKGKNLLRAIFCGVPWACEGLGVYGFGVFLPVLCIALGIEHSIGTEANVVQHLDKVLNSIKVTTVVNCFMIPGFIAGLFLLRKVYHPALQTWGFIVAAAGLGLLLFAYETQAAAWLSIAGLAIFEIFLNAGPHLMTFILPSQIYPVSDRSQGSGLAASIGKSGAVLAVFFIPMLLQAGGARLVLWVSIAVMLAGALLTAVLAPVVLPRKQKD